MTIGTVPFQGETVYRIVRLIVLFMFVSAAQAAEYVPGELYVKYAETGTAGKAGAGSPDEVIGRYGGYDNRPAFSPIETLAARKTGPEQQARLSSLAAIRRVSFPLDLDIEYIARKITADPTIEYAEPVWINHLCYEPNDPVYNDVVLNAEQDYLRFVNTPAAWDLSRGDSTITIAIVDSGSDWRHPDLSAHVWTNPGEIPGNGQDDDGNGYADDVHGWDFDGNDSDVVPIEQPHGTHVAGIAAAVTDNGIGIASLSYSVRFMPIKTGADNSREIYYGYEGILYAAANGADIINCSWGSPYLSYTGRQVVDAVTGQGVLVVAAAGNDNTDIPFYPAAFTHVIGVGSIDLDGSKSSFSNYGAFVDVSAPGNHIFSTVLDNEYGYMLGTSMAAPVVSALAALIRAAHPDWDADQIQAQILGTVVPFPPEFPYLCGCGYINAGQALGAPVSHLNVVTSVFSDSPGDGETISRPGEEITSEVVVRNYGAPVGEVTMIVQSVTGSTTPLDVSRNIGPFGHREQKETEIRFLVAEGVPVNTHETIRLDFSSQGKTVGFATIEALLNPSFATLAANTIELSFGDVGTLGYVDYPTNMNGRSFIIRMPPSGENSVFETPLIFEAGLMFGNTPSNISGVIRGPVPSVQDKDFVSAEPIAFEVAPEDSSQTGRASFTDDGADTGAYGIVTTFTGYAFTGQENDRFIILTYRFENTRAAALIGMRAGLFFDLDIPEFLVDDDQAFYVAADDIIAIAEDTSTRPDRVMVGVACLESIASPYIVINPDEIYDGFTDEEKWGMLSAGMTGSTLVDNTDVSFVASPPPFDLPPGGQ
ncbi:S8 family peptidase [Candidatus Latescibacterota bacterium]